MWLSELSKVINIICLVASAYINLLGMMSIATFFLVSLVLLFSGVLLVSGISVVSPFSLDSRFKEAQKSIVVN